MKAIIYLLLVCTVAIAADAPPQTVIPRQETNPQLRLMWANPIEGCDILNYYLFDYTDRHPERVKFVGKDDIVTVEGFIGYLRAKTPIMVRDGDGHRACLIFFQDTVLTPWGQEIVFLMDRKKDGYLSAFGERASVSAYADPWKEQGFKYFKAVGITLKKRPTFADFGGRLLVPLNDNEYKKFRDVVFTPK